MGKKIRGLSGLSGVILIDKPTGWTSHDVVARLRTLTKERRIGHNGTLDPFATGLMAVMIGPATRLSDFLTTTTKEYIATIAFGSFTDTDDCEGATIGVLDVPDQVFDEAFAVATVSRLIGTVSQIPPAYSSIKQGGVVAHKAARAGHVLDLKPREVTIHEAELLNVDSHSRTWKVRLSVSKGTYIRSIARDLGQSLGTGAHLIQLRRTKSGDFDVTEAISLDDLSQRVAEPHDIADYFVPATSLVGKLPFVLSTDRHTMAGKSIDLPLDEISTSSLIEPSTPHVPILSLDNRLLALYRFSVKEDSIQYLVPDVVLRRGVCGPRINRCVATMGVFDGVHKGHVRLLAQVVHTARQLNVPSIAVTFDVLPEVVIEHQHVPNQLSALEHRIALIKEQGIDEVVIIPFDDELADSEPERFVLNHLLSRINPIEFIVGDNFRFGRQGSGDYQVLADVLAKFNCKVSHIPLESLGSKRISSTAIRDALSAGDIGSAADLLGREIVISGEVVRGQGLGAGLGFPTANLRYSDNVLALADGVYAAHALVHPEMEIYKAAVFIGTPSTLGVSGKTVEAHLLDANTDLYGKKVSLTFHARIREAATFKGVQELKEAIRKDIAQIRSILD